MNVVFAMLVYNGDEKNRKCMQLLIGLHTQMKINVISTILINKLNKQQY